MKSAIIGSSKYRITYPKSSNAAVVSIS